MKHARALQTCLLAALLLTAASGAHAQSLIELFSAGNQAYFQGDFKHAAGYYQRLVDAGVDDPDVYFNLGTACARNGELGRAILYFERAERLSPGDTDAAQALATARAALGKRRAEAQGEATVETRPPVAEALVRPYRESTLAGLVLGLDLLFFALLFGRRFLLSETLRNSFAISAAVAALSLIAAAGALAQKSGAFDEGRAAVVLRDGAEVREGPDPRARSRAQAHEGQSARVLRRDGSFLRVRIGGGAQGWMQDRDVAMIASD